MVNRRNPLRGIARKATALLIVPLAVLAAGCGSSSPSADTTPTTAASGASGGTGRQTAGLAAFQTCLKQHGITTTGGFGRPPGGSGANPPPSTGQGGTPPAGASGRGGGPAGNLTPAQQKAFTACRSKLPAGTGGFGQRSTGSGQAANPALAKYTKCLSQHGVKFGSTNSSSTAAFKKASAACAKYLPSGTGGNQPPTTTAGQ